MYALHGPVCIVFPTHPLVTSSLDPPFRILLSLGGPLARIWLGSHLAGLASGWSRIWLGSHLAGLVPGCDSHPAPIGGPLDVRHEVCRLLVGSIFVW